MLYALKQAKLEVVLLSCSLSSMMWKKTWGEISCMKSIVSSFESCMMDYMKSTKKQRRTATNVLNLYLGEQITWDICKVFLLRRAKFQNSKNLNPCPSLEGHQKFPGGRWSQKPQRTKYLPWEGLGYFLGQHQNKCWSTVGTSWQNRKI